MKRFEVSLTEDASRDLEEIVDYIAEHDGAAKANHVLDRIEEVVESLATLPERGSHPKELLRAEAATNGAPRREAALW